jgi:hypothetical protein
MHGDDVGARLGEGFEVGIARRDHQVHVERLLRVRPYRLHHVGSNRDVGNEMPVHHIDMDPVRARGIDRAHLLAQPSKVAGENRGRNDEGMPHQFCSSGALISNISAEVACCETDMRARSSYGTTT